MRVISRISLSCTYLIRAGIKIGALALCIDQLFVQHSSSGTFTNETGGQALQFNCREWCILVLWVSQKRLIKFT